MGARSLMRAAFSQRDRMHYALSGFSSLNRYSAAGGESGIGTGFGVVAILAVSSLNAASNRVIVGRTNSSDKNWALYLTTSNTLAYYARNAADSALPASPGFLLTPTDVNRILIVMGWHDGAGLRLAVARGTHNTALVTPTGYTATPGVSEAIGANAAGQVPAPGVHLLEYVTFRGAPSDEQITDYFDRARADLELPDSFIQPAATLADVLALGPSHYYRMGDAQIGGGNVSLIPNLAAPGVNELSPAAGILPPPAASTELDGKPVLSFDGTRKLAASGLASDWRFLHDLSGCHLTVVGQLGAANGNHFLLSTRNASGAADDNGLSVNFDATPNMIFDTYNHVGNVEPDISIAAPFRPNLRTVEYTNIANGDRKAWVNYSLVASAATAGTVITENPSSTLRVGGLSGSTTNFLGDIAELIFFRKQLTEFQRTTLRNFHRAEYGIGRVVITHAWSAKRTLRSLSLPSERRVFGARNFGALVYLRTADPGGIAGAPSGFRVACWARFDTLPGLAQTLAARSNNTNAGWTLNITTGNQLRFTCADGTGALISSTTYQLTSADLGRPRYVEAQHTGSALRLYLDGVALADVAITGYTAHAGPMTIGQVAGAQAAVGVAIFGLSGGHFVSTQAEVTAARDAFATTGRPVQIPAKTSWHSDFSASLSSSTSSFPTTISEQLGGDHLTRVGGVWKQDANSLWFDGGAYYQDAASGSVMATRPWIAVKLRIRTLSVPYGARYLVSRSNGSNQGVELRFLSSTTIQFYATDGSGARVGVTIEANASDVGVIRTVVARVDSLGYRRLYLRNRATTAEAGPFTGYTTSALPIQIGARDLPPSLTNCDLIGVALGNSDLTDAELDALLADTDPATAPIVAGKTERRYHLGPASSQAPLNSIPDLMGANDPMYLVGQSLEVAIHAGAAPLAPVQLSDRITSAPADAMIAQALASVTTFDPLREGRTLRGLISWDGGRLESALSDGIAPPTGFVFAAVVTWDGGLLSGTRFLARFSDYDSTRGWSLGSSGTNLNFSVCAYPLPTTTATLVLSTTADHLQHELVIANFTGGQLQLARFRPGLPLTITSPIAGVMYPMIHQVPLIFGNSYNGYTGFAGAIHQAALAAAPGGLTFAQLQAMCSEFAASGRLSLPTGLSSARYYDIDRDLGAASDAPAQVLDRLGTSHLSVRSGGPRLATYDGHVGLIGIDAYHSMPTFQTGIAGTATGFWVGALINTGIYIAYPQTILAKWDLGNNGWQFSYGSNVNPAANTIALTVGTGSAVKSTTSYTVAPGTWVHVALVYDPNVGGGTLYMFINGVLRGSIANVGGFSPDTQPMYLGSVRGTTYPAPGVCYYGLGGAHAIPTAQEIADAATASLAAKSFVAIPGKTDKWWDLKADIAAAGGAVPLVFPERISGTDRLTRGNPDLKLRVTERTERTRTHEIAAVFRGLSAFSDANRYSALDGFDADATGWWGLVAFIVTSQTVTSNTRGLISRVSNAPIAGWDVRLTGTNSLITFGMADGTSPTPNYQLNGSTAITATDLNRVQVFGFGFDPSVSYTRCYWKRAAIAPAARNGVTPAPSGPLTLGALSYAGYPSDSGIIIIGAALGNGWPQPGEWNQAYDAIVSRERVVGIANRTLALYDVQQDIIDAGGSAPTTITNRAGSTGHLTRGGSAPTVSPLYGRTFGW